MTRPNIVLISADQHRADCFGFAGRRVKTPHLDQLARQGMHFTACITPSLVCQPARASILTGQLCRTHGVHDNGIDLDPGIGVRGFAGQLSDAGYRTALFGKAHFATYHTTAPTGSPENVLSSPDYPDNWFGPYMGFDHVEIMLVGHNWFLPEAPPRGQHYERWFYADGHGPAKNAAYRAGQAAQSGAAQTWHSQLPPAWHNTTWTADRAIEWLKQRDNTPFCTWISFPDPHHPFDAPEPWSRLHDPADIDLPPHRARDLADRPWWYQAALEGEPEGSAENAEIRRTFSRIPPQSDDQLREIIANTYGQIALIDHNVGRILIALAEAGLSENTYVIYMSDHGDWLGDHGLLLKGPMPFEGLLRVPLIVRGPGIGPNTTCAEPVSTLDLSPTFLEIAGAKPALDQHGQSLIPLLQGQSTARDCALSEWELLPGRVGVGLSLRTVRTKTHKLTMDLRSNVGELYDLQADPHELTNLFDRPEVADIQRQLMACMAQRPDDMAPIGTAVGTA